MMCSSFLLLLLPAIYIPTLMSDSWSSETVLSHKLDPDPNREKFIWNPFPGNCGLNASMVRCAGVCPETCRFKSQKCPQYCGVNCKCKSGYVFSDNLLKCILRQDCPSHIQQQVVETHRVFQ
ncbi:accessory gland protein Acp62F [Drosophila bipectinata]|uniref:accessory gland protein Acp62F n=1 Tax=Drosophila bipectinata TaxID=42026 RepID=UPI001C8A0C2A|nr:accessory gland protein Acp62F [Drosophila bipectinata]